MLIAIAFLCSVDATDCTRDYIDLMVVGKGNTPLSCAMDGQEGLARSDFKIGDGEKIFIDCRDPAHRVER